MRDPIGNKINYDIEEKYERLHEKKAPLARIVRSDFSREQPNQVTFQQLLTYHDRTPQLQIAVGSYSELITGTEMILKTKNPEAQKFLDEWVRITNFMISLKVW